MSKEDAEIAAAHKLLTQQMSALRRLGLPPKDFDRAAEAAFKGFRRALFGGAIWDAKGPRDTKNSQWDHDAYRATAKHARLDYTSIKIDRAEYKAILFNLDGSEIWIPRSQILEVSYEENVVLVTRWWLQRNGYANI